MRWRPTARAPRLPARTPPGAGAQLPPSAAGGKYHQACGGAGLAAGHDPPVSAGGRQGPGSVRRGRRARRGSRACGAAKDYTLLHTPTRNDILRATMGAIETRVAPCGLIRVHRSAIVRAGAVRSLQHSAAGAATLVLDGGIAVPVGPSYLPEVTKRFART